MNSLLIHANELALTRYVLATVWIVTGILSLGVFPQQQSLAMLSAVGLDGTPALVALYGSASMDILFGLLTLRAPSLWLWRTQVLVIVIYSAIIAVCLPDYYLHPFGPILKNLPILLLLWLLHQREREKSHG